MHVYVYSLVIRYIDRRVEFVCNIYVYLVSIIIAPARQSRPRARDSPTSRRTSRDGTLSIIKKCAERLRRVVVARPLAPLSFVR